MKLEHLLFAGMFLLAMGCGQQTSVPETSTSPPSQDTAFAQLAGVNNSIVTPPDYEIAGGGELSESSVSYSVPWMSQVPPGSWDRTLNCGPASLLMVLSYYNDIAPQASELISLDRELASIDPSYRPNDENGDVTSASQLVTLANRHGFSASKAVKIKTIDSLHDSLKKNGPCIVSFRTRLSADGSLHWVVVTGADKSYFYLHDPGRSASAPRTVRENAAVERQKFWSIFTSAGGTGVIIPKTASTTPTAPTTPTTPTTPTIDWSNYVTVYRHLDSKGGRHYSTSDQLSLEREAFVVMTTNNLPNQATLYTCDKSADGIIAANSDDRMALIGAGYSCQFLGYSVPSSVSAYPFAAVCPVRRYRYTTSQGTGAHLFTVSLENLTGQTLEQQAAFYVFSNNGCY